MDISEKDEDEEAVSRACSALGSMFNKLHKYDEAADYFSKSFNIARSQDDDKKIDYSRIHYGIVAGHKMIKNLTENYDFASKPMIQNLIEWKDNRYNNFKK